MSLLRGFGKELQSHGFVRPHTAACKIAQSDFVLGIRIPLQCSRCVIADRLGEVFLNADAIVVHFSDLVLSKRKVLVGCHLDILQGQR